MKKILYFIIINICFSIFDEYFKNIIISYNIYLMFYRLFQISIKYKFKKIFVITFLIIYKS